MKVVIELDVHEAMAVLPAIEARALEVSKAAAKSSGDAHEVGLLNAQVLRRVAGRITAALYPEPEDTRAWTA